MSLCVAWRWQEKVCLATDSCISIDAGQPRFCGIKVLQLPVRVISPIERDTGRFETIFQTVYGLCFSGRFLTAYLVKESISELLLNLQFVGADHDLTFQKICDVVHACYVRVVSELNGDEFGHDTDFFMVGSCPFSGKNLVAKFYRNGNGDLKWTEIVSQRPFSYEAAGAGEDTFRMLFDDARQKIASVHFAAFDAMDKVLTSRIISSVGGAIQYGDIESGREFRLFGIVDYGRNGNEIKVQQVFRGMDLKELYEGKDILDLHVHYDFVDPLRAKKQRIFQELGIPWTTMTEASVPEATEPNPTHLFISYAVEDATLAKWLARKLAARGHPVWFDQMKLLGGEQWPQTIDEAIKNRTLRMLALISEHSLRKHKPTGERTLAQRIAEQRKIPDFLIPLKVDGSELDWLTTTVSYISFTRGWADGWRALVKKLDSISAPRSLANAAPLAASSFPRGDDLVNDSGEQLRTNIIRVKSFPNILRVFQVVRSVEPDDWKTLEQTWAFYEIAKDALVALIPPPAEFTDRIKPTPEQLLWAECELFRNVRARDIAASLIMKALSRRLTKAGCLEHPNPKLKETFFLPESFSKDGKLSFSGFRGRKTWLLIRGRVTFRRAAGLREVNFHHFAFRLRLARGLGKEFHVQLAPTLMFFDEKGNPIVDKSVGSRRRRMTKMWYNDKWLNRVMAAEHVLTSLPAAGADDLVLEPGLVALRSPYGLNEAVLEPEAPSEDTGEELQDQELELDEREAEEGNE